MKSSVLRRYVDILMYMAMCFVAGSGLLIGYRLAPCSRGGDHGQTLLGMSRHQWGEWHLYAAYLVLALLIIHLILNLSFIINIVASKSRLLLASLTIAGAVIVAWFLIAPLQKEPGGRKCGEGTCPSAGDSTFVCPSSGSCPSASK